MCQQSKTLAASTGLVIGATQPEAIQHIRQRYPEVWFLSPGIGAQQADLVQCLEAGRTGVQSNALFTFEISRVAKQWLWNDFTGLSRYC